jgi:hypothetical protein
MRAAQKQFFVDELYKLATKITELEHATNCYEADFSTIIEDEKLGLTHITIRTRPVTEEKADEIERGYEVAKEVKEKNAPENRTTDIHNVDDNNKIIRKE